MTTVYVWEILIEREKVYVCTCLKWAEFNGRYVGEMTENAFNKKYR